MKIIIALLAVAIIFTNCNSNSENPYQSKYTPKKDTITIETISTPVEFKNCGDKFIKINSLQGNKIAVMRGLMIDKMLLNETIVDNCFISITLVSDSSQYKTANGKYLPWVESYTIGPIKNRQ